MPKHKAIIWTGEETMDKAEFIEAFKKVLEIVARIKEENARKLNEIISTFGSLKSKLDSDTSTALIKTERITAAELESLLRRFFAEQKKIDDKLATIENGKDADEIKIMSDVLAQLPKLQEIVDETLRQIPRQEEKIFEIDDIKNLKDELEELKKLRTGKYGSGGTPKTRMISEVPSGTIDGSNAEFTITTTPIIGHALFLNSALQRESASYEYTIVNKKITYNVAPPKNSQHYMLIFR